MKPPRERRWPGAILWVAVPLAVTAAIATAVLRRGGPLAPRLELIALGADGRFGTAVRLPDPESAGYPLVLAVVNRGGRAAHPRRLHLSLPAWLRLVGGDGAEYATERPPGDPLARASLELEAEPVEPGAFPLVPAGLDRLRLESRLHPVDCRLAWDGVPVFEPAAPWDVARLSEIAIYWSIDEGGRRQAGLLRLSLRPDSLVPEPATMEFGETTTHPGGAPQPDTGPRSLERSFPVTCGEPARRLELLAETWRAETGGLMIVVLHADRPRLHLFDLDSDGRVELEIRDSDGDGIFESRRPVEYAIPAFLTGR